MAETVATYSICACDLAAGQWGVATQSKFLAVGSVVPWAAPHIGAIATQSYANPRYGPEGLELLREGYSAEEVVERLTAADGDRALRQLGIVDGEGRAATFTGEECHAWAGGRTGSGYAAQGNILVSGDTVDALAETFEATGGRPLAERLLDCLDAAEAAGGDSRGRQSAALLVVERDGGYASLSDTLVDLRVDDHPEPLVELRRIHRLHDLLFGTHAAAGLDPGRRRAPRRARRAARAGRASEPRRVGGGRESRGAGRGRRRDRPGRARATTGGDMSERYGVTTLEELATPPIPGQARWHTIRRTLGVSSFGVNAWTATEDGGQIIGEHEEASGQAHEELYIVLTGRATFTVDGEEVDGPAGTLVHVADPAVKRGAVGEEGTTILVVGAKPGEAFTPSTWERSAEALQFWPNEEWDKAIEVLERHLAETPDHAGTHYNLACAHARAGRPDVALDHARKAIELQESFGEYAVKDDDLVSIHDQL